MTDASSNPTTPPMGGRAVVNLNPETERQIDSVDTRTQQLMRLLEPIAGDGDVLAEALLGIAAKLDQLLHEVAEIKQRLAVLSPAPASGIPSPAPATR